MFRDQYKALFDLGEDHPLNILEIGCGPGALAAALLRWYPNSKITAIDRDSAFIEFAKTNLKGIEFLEGDATALPFADNTFDVTISNTVAEHVKPEAFYDEQMRVLKEHGICLVLSARRGITVNPPCITVSDFEKEFWTKAEKRDSRMDDYAVGRYHMTEAELPAAMEQYGFSDIATGYAAINLTPDNPGISSELACEMILANRANDLDSINSVVHALPDCFTSDEIAKMLQLTNDKYDIRLAQYQRGEKQWDSNLSVTMVIRGVKR